MGGDENLGNNDRIVTGFAIGTAFGTIFTSPINYSALVFGFRYANALNSGTIGTVVVEMRTARLGTFTGTIDVAQTSGSPPVRAVPGEIPWGRVEAGDSLVGAIVSPSAAGSIEGVVSYRYMPGRQAAP